MKMSDLSFPYFTPDEFELPARDPYGVPHGVNYVPFHRAIDMNLATRANFSGVKVARVHEALSLNEARAILDFSFNSYVIDIREQYPVYKQDAYNRARFSGKRMARAAVMTLDVVLTLAYGPHLLHYHVVSIKDATDSEFSDRAKRRMARERDACEARGWTWELLLGSAFSKRTFGNQMLMRSWMLGIDVWSYRRRAQGFALHLLDHSTTGTLGAIVARNARYMGITRNHAFSLFGIAVCFGYLAVDHSEDLRVDRPLKLLIG